MTNSQRVSGITDRTEGPPDAFLKITPAMIAAGIFEAREHALGAPLEELVSKVYIAMVLEAPRRKSQPRREGF